ncbi:MAG TPA: hypothetical protein VHV83_05310, partial [Armatimonadota bacterium]|nr:hypothetical protein [Armatimonadota bacterium]
QPELRQTLGICAQKRAESLSAYRCTERLVGVYNQVLACRPYSSLRTVASVVAHTLLATNRSLWYNISAIREHLLEEFLLLSEVWLDCRDTCRRKIVLRSVRSADD